jgi:hypothetical protein
MRDILLFIGSLAGAAILTAIAVIVSPSSPIWKWILWGGIGVFTACAIVLLIDYLRPGGSVFSLSGIGIGIALAITFTISFAAGSPHTVISVPRTLKDAFLLDYTKTLLSSSTNRSVTVNLPNGDKATVPLMMRVYYDFAAGSKFISVYVPSTIAIRQVCFAIANSAVETMNAQDAATPVSGEHAGEMTSSTQLKFSGRIYVYHESPILRSDRDELSSYFRQKDLDIIFRGESYLRDTAPAGK